MGAKSRQKVISPSTGAVVDEIDANGVWEFANIDGLRSDLPTRVFFKKGSGNDPVGATVSMGYKVDNLTPEPINGASMALPSLASTTASIPVRIFLDGRVCVTVGSLPAGAKIIPVVIQ